MWLTNEYETCKICEREKFTETEMENFCIAIFGSETPDNAKLSEVNWTKISEAFID